MQLPKSLSRLATFPEGARSGRWIQSLPLLVSAGLVVLLAWQLVQFGWTLLDARKAPPPSSGQTVGVSAPTGPAVDLQAILNAHLFGVAGAVESGATDPNSVAATQMNLVLVGTIAEADPARGYAIIGDSAATAKVYAVGKTITGGTKLHSVYPDRAILDRGGRLEALLLPRKFTGGGMAPVANATPQRDAMLGESLRNLAAQNPGAITEIIRPQPVFANGQQRGYRVYPGRNRDQFTKLGLMPGDLVTGINGTPLDDAARGMEILQSMNASTDVTVTVERNGQTTQININNAQVAADAAAAAAMSEAIPVSEMPPVAPQQDLTE
jgi:general secretion pathway protein C